MPDYTVLNTQQGDCIDNPYIVAAMENLRYLEQCSRTNTEQFSCVAVDGLMEVLVKRTTTETCVTLIELDENQNPDATSATEQKVLLLTYNSTLSYNISGSDEAELNTTTTIRNWYIKCNGEVVRTISYQELNSPVVVVPFSCAANATVELCVESHIVSQNLTVTANSEIQVCGALVCIKELQNDSIQGYFMPPSVPADCRYSREAIHLIRKNLAALAAQFSAFGQQYQQYQYLFNDDVDHTLINATPTETQFLILGKITVCGQNANKDATATIVVKPKVSCGGTEISCLTRSITLRDADDNVQSGCVVAPVAICGTCAAGQTLEISLLNEVQCDENPTQLISGFQTGITSVEQDLCVFAFSKVPNDVGDELNTGLANCLALRDFQSIEEVFASIKEICDNQQPIVLNDDVGGSGTSPEGSVVIEPAQPWPPLNDPTNTDPVPVATRFIAFSAIARLSSEGGLNAEDTRLVRANVRLMCGDTELASGTTTWYVTFSGGFFPVSSSMGNYGCYACPIDQDLRLEFDSFLITGFNGQPDLFTYNVSSFSF